MKVVIGAPLPVEQFCSSAFFGSKMKVERLNVERFNVESKRIKNFKTKNLTSKIIEFENQILKWMLQDLMSK